MGLFDVPENNQPTAEALMQAFLKETDLEFEATLQRAYDSIQRFWYRNRDEEGNPALEGDQPSGIEMLQAAGTNAEAFLDAAFLRVQMLLQAQALRGRDDLVDLSKVAAPFEFTFNPDGSLASWTPRQ